MAGRKLGSKNKQTSKKDFKDQLEWAFNKVNHKGEYLLNLAATEPKAFAGLLAKLMPSNITVDHNNVDLGIALIDASARLQAMTTVHDVTPDTLIIEGDSKQVVTDD